jgi:hypothetical protein
MAKNPYLDFHTGDWLKDPKLSACLPATRGIWMDAICAMHESGSFVLEGSLDQLSRILRATPPEVQSAVDDLKSTGAADVTLRNGKVTLVNRKRKKAAIIRDQTKERVKKHRGNAKETPCNAPYHIPNKPLPPISPPIDDRLKLAARAIWEIYPAARRGALEDAIQALSGIGCDNGTVDHMLAAVNALKDGDWKRDRGKYIPGLVKWLKARAWESIEIEPGDEALPEPAGSDPRPPKGMRWRTDSDGRLVHPLEAVPLQQ